MRKDIFDLFRERAAQIEETPSPQAWNRLERRLNSRRPSLRREARRVSLHRSLGMVASLALVLGLIAGLVWLAERRPAAAIARQGTPTVIEDLALHASNAADFPVPEIVRRHPDMQASKPITEGRPQQKLVVKGEPSPTPSVPADTTREAEDDRREMGR